MSKEAIQGIEVKVKELQEQAQKHTQYLSELTNNIKKFRHDRKVIEGNLNKLDGAIQAYSESARLLKEAENVVQTEA